MLGFLQTIINAIESIYDTVANFFGNIVYYISIFVDLIDAFRDVANNSIPLPLQAVASVVICIAITRLVVSLGGH